MADEPVQEQHSVGDLAKLADLYHVPMSHGTLKDMGDENGNVSPEKHAAFEDYLKTAAQGLYPTVTSYFPKLKPPTLTQSCVSRPALAIDSRPSSLEGDPI